MHGVSTVFAYRGTLLIGKRPPPMTAIGPQAQDYCRVPGGVLFLMSEIPL